MISTFEDYITAIKRQYEIEKNATYSGFLLKPSPAQLRNLCLLFYENGLNANDEQIFRIFFHAKEDADLRKCIENFDVDKFKSIGQFLKGKSEKTSVNSLNLIAILVNFQPRPLNRFIHEDNESTTAIVIKREIGISDAATKMTAIRTATLTGLLYKKVSIRQIVKTLIPIVVVLLSAYFIKDIFFPEKECMQWQKDHYEAVDCSRSIPDIGTTNEVKPIDEDALKLKKIEVTKKTPFFQNDKPLVWYGKKNGKPEYFNTSGYHPETGKLLKPISHYMIKKYVKK